MQMNSEAPIYVSQVDFDSLFNSRDSLMDRCLSKNHSSIGNALTLSSHLKLEDELKQTQTNTCDDFRSSLYRDSMIINQLSNFKSSYDKSKDAEDQFSEDINKLLKGLMDSISEKEQLIKTNLQLQYENKVYQEKNDNLMKSNQRLTMQLKEMHQNWMHSQEELSEKYDQYFKIKEQLDQTIVKQTLELQEQKRTIHHLQRELSKREGQQSNVNPNTLHGNSRLKLKMENELAAEKVDIKLPGSPSKDYADNLLPTNHQCMSTIVYGTMKDKMVSVPYKHNASKNKAFFSKDSKQNQL